MKRTFRRVQLAMATAAVITAGAGVAVASDQAVTSSHVIHACYVKSGGALRVVSRTAHCPTGQAPLHWNVRGPRGPRGLRGPQGPGARVLRFAHNSTDADWTVIGKVSGLVFEAKCSAPTAQNGNSTQIKFHLVVPAGQQVSEAGDDVSGTGSAYSFHVAGFGGEVNIEELSTTSNSVNTLDYTIVSSSGAGVQMFATISADSSATSPDTFCEITGNLTPLS